jgi:flagellin
MGALIGESPQIHASNKENPMSLGVLNNLNAIHAQNSLNNTSNSLSTVLQQLSSGSRINSGADDAAGLSLVNGLQANEQALTQSKTNATEGVGLLTVADGALSQVTSLLNRAVTLATEASNGTLNSSQDSAANSEYQSILSEINNIGATTTYNQQTVFGSNTSIYTGDSSVQGASIDALNIRSLSSSNVGDTGGVMSYSNGTNNVFLDLSSSGKNAAVTDTLGATTATTNIAVNYLAKGSNGSTVSATATISVGAGTSYANTAQGLISAINGSGLGITASFGTAAQAGTAATATATSANDTNSALLTGGTDTGIIISGTGVAVNNNSSTAGYSNGAGEVGTLTVSNVGDQLAGTLNVVGSDGASHSITLGTTNSTDTLANLMSTINASGYGVTATLNTTGSTTNASGTHATNTVLTFTSASSEAAISGTGITDAELTQPTIALTNVSAGGAIGAGAGTVLAKLTVANASDTLSGLINVTKDVAAAVATPYNLNGQTLAQIVTYVNANNGVGASFANITASTNAAAVGNQAAGTILTFTETANTLAIPPAIAANATGTNVITDNSATSGASVVTAAATVAIGAAGTLGAINVTNSNDALTSGSITISGTKTGGTVKSYTLGTAGSTDNLSNLLTTINADTGTSGVTAAWTSTAHTGLSLTAAVGGTLQGAVWGASTGSTLSLTGTPTAAGAASETTLGNLYLPTGSTSATAPTGTLTIGTETIALNVAATTTTPGTQTMSALAQTINAGNYGITATLNSTGTALTFLSPNSNATNVTITGGTNTTFDTENAGQTSSSYYSVGISGTVQDTSTGANTTNALTKGLSSDSNGSNGVATISYSDAAGVSLASTDLSNQTDAKAALTALNAAITAVAAQDGYIGAQINTLNAVSSVLSTQSENVTAAQNAVQATDYASATSNMSKYEILSQTGISALAQANSVQQEVTKLLQ